MFFAGRRIAQSTPSTSTVHYYFADHLGSTRAVTDSTGNACYKVDFLPYGTENTPSGFTNTCSTNYKFTGYERDSETAYGNSSGNDYAVARYYNARLGRFMSGDPLAGGANDPQTMNRYAYARNNPVNMIDPTGMITQINPIPPDPPQQGPPDALCPDFWDCAMPGGCGDLTGGSCGNPEGIDFPVTPPPPPPPPPQTQAAQQNACTQPILNAVNNQFGTNFTADNIQGDPFPNGGAMNLNILGTGLPAAEFNSIQTGRYPVNWWSYAIGYGPTLHITGQGLFDPAPAGFTNSNVGGVTSVSFTAHIDTSFAYNPIGALIHLFTDLLHLGGPRNPCP